MQGYFIMQGEERHRMRPWSKLKIRNISEYKVSNTVNKAKVDDLLERVQKVPVLDSQNYKT